MVNRGNAAFVCFCIAAVLFLGAALGAHWIEPMMLVGLFCTALGLAIKG